MKISPLLTNAESEDEGEDDERPVFDTESDQQAGDPGCQQRQVV